jgi:hypothetical protein
VPIAPEITFEMAGVYMHMASDSDFASLVLAEIFPRHWQVAPAAGTT